MNYEDFYQALQPQEKALKDKITSLQKLLKAIGREIEDGDIKSLTKDLNAMTETTVLVSASIEEIKNEVEAFDIKAYFESGEFTEQMLTFCQENSVNVCGEDPVYEMFPYRVRLDMENQDIYLDQKKVQCIRPKSLVEMVQNGQAKLNKASFNAAVFADELADAYDMAVLKLKKRPQADIYLISLYKILAPMSRFRKNYDQQSFAFDLARLYMSGIEETKNGRKFQFGSTKLSDKAIRILDKNGRERFLSTICFFE